MKNVDKHGFTLVELLIVVLIIGILSAVALPQYQKAVARAKYARLKVMGTKIAEVERLYYWQHARWTTDFSELDLDFGDSELKEGSSGVYNEISGHWGSCYLRDYALGSVQCSVGEGHDIPEFNVSRNFTQQLCVAYHDAGPGAASLCQKETGKSAPDEEHGAYDVYIFD